MRIADKMALNQVQASLSKNRADMNDLQNQAATQKRINKPSDDPLAAARVLAARTEERGITQFVKTTNFAKSFLEFTDQSLSELTDALMRAKEVAIGQASDAGASSQTRLMASTEIEQIYSQAVQIGNRRFGERFIFGGFQTKKAPFENNGNYIGDDGDMKVQIQKDSFVAMNIPGDKVFLGRGAGADGFIRPKAMTSRTTDQLLEEKEYENYRNEKNQEIEKQAHIDVRGPASRGSSIRPGVDEDSLGVNIFNVLSDLNIALKTNDKKEIQRNLDSMDLALQQVVFTRSQVGSRVSILNSNLDSLQKNSVDSKLIASQLEDADAFQVFSEMNKSDSALKATLQTTGKLIQPSLLDFIK